MSSVVSCFSSAKTEVSLSEMSLYDCSSARRTNYTSFSDYETPLMSPQSVDTSKDSEKSLPRTPEFKYVVTATQSSCTVKDKIASDRQLLLGVKSDSCVSLQSKAINDFMDDVFRVQNQHQGEPNLLFSDDKSSVSELCSARESPSNTSDFASMANLGDAHYYDPDEYFSRNQKTGLASIVETKHRIIENLSHVTSDNLFSKSSRRCVASPSFPGKIQSKLLAKSSLQSQKSRKSRRTTSIDSILRIDYELQPLNLKLSRLLAEFKVLELKSMLDTPPVTLGSCGPVNWSTRSFKSVAVGSDSGITLNKDYQDYLKYKEERDAFVKFLKNRDHVSLAQKRFNEYATASENSTENCTQTTRSCGDYRAERISKRNQDIQLSKSAEKRNTSGRCSKRHYKRYRREHQITVSPPRTFSKGEDFSCKILDEISQIQAKCDEISKIEEAEKYLDCVSNINLNWPSAEKSKVSEHRDLDIDQKDLVDLPEQEHPLDTISIELNAENTEDQENKARWEESGS